MKYRLDRRSFKVQTFREADHQRSFWLKRDVRERLRAAWYLISSAWGFSPDEPPRMDKQRFSMRKHTC